MKKLIENVKDNYYNCLTIKYKILFLNRIFYPLKRLKFYIYNKKPKFLSKKEVDSRSLNITQYNEVCIEKGNNVFTKYNVKIKQKIKNLNDFCGTSDFQNKVKDFDEEMELENGILKDELNRIVIEFHSKCNKEVESFQNAILGDSYKDFQSYISSYIQGTETAKKTMFTSFAVGGGIFCGAGVYGLIFGGASIALPVIGIILGGIYVVGTLGAIGYRLFKGKKKVHQEYIEEYYNKIKKQIQESQKEFQLSIYQSSQNYIKQIREINDLQLENPHDYLNKKELFENNLNDIFQFIISLKNLFLNNNKT